MFLVSEVPLYQGILGWNKAVVSEHFRRALLPMPLLGEYGTHNTVKARL